MKRIYIILSILVVFVMSMVQISNVSAKDGPLQPYPAPETSGWIVIIDNVLKKVVILTRYYLGPDFGYWSFAIFVTEDTKITIDAKPGTFEDLEPGQYATCSYTQEEIFFTSYCNSDFSNTSYENTALINLWCKKTKNP